MGQIKFDKNGFFIPQIVKLNIKRNELDEGMFEEYIKKKTEFQINYDHKGNPIFKEKKINRKGGKRNGYEEE